MGLCFPLKKTNNFQKNSFLLWCQDSILELQFIIQLLRQNDYHFPINKSNKISVFENHSQNGYQKTFESTENKALFQANSTIG